MKLALGTVQFGLPYGIANLTGQVSRDEALVMLHLARENGIDVLDTAIAYGNSEDCLGSIGVDGFRIVTKLPALPDICSDVRSWVRCELEASMSRLGISAVYGLLLHRPDQLLSSHGKILYDVMQELKADGLVHKIGISIYSPHELENVAAGFVVDLVQMPFNLIDRRIMDSGWLQRLKDYGVEIHTRSVFLQGLLLMSKGMRPSRFSPWAQLWERWDDWLNGSGILPLQACLAFVLGFSEVDRVVVGADSFQQLQEIIDASRIVDIGVLPDLRCHDERLVNPSKWADL